MNSNLNMLGNMYAANVPNVSKFNIVITTSVLLNSSKDWILYPIQISPSQLENLNLYVL